MSSPEPIDFQRVVWRDKDLANPGDPFLSAEVLNNREEAIERLVETVNNNLGMVSQLTYETGIAGRFPLLPELTIPYVTNPVANRDDMLFKTTRFNITTAKTQELPNVQDNVILAVAVTQESSGTLTINAAGTNRIGLSATTTKDMKPGDYILLRGAIINNVGRWIRLSGPLLSETDTRYTLPGDTGFTQSDADELYEKIGVAETLVENITKSSIGLGNVANLTPEEMPISDDVQDALDALAIAPPRRAAFTNVTGNFKPNYEDGTLQRYKIIGDCKLLKPLNGQDQASIRFEFFLDNAFSKKIDLDPSINNVSLVPFPYTMESNKIVVAVLIYSDWGQRWMLTTFIPEP